MQPEIEVMLSLATDPEQVGDVIEAACAAFGAVVRRGVTVARLTPQPGDITGIVELQDAIAPTVANTLGAESLGSRLVVFRYQAPKGFRVTDNREIYPKSGRVSSASEISAASTRSAASLFGVLTLEPAASPWGEWLQPENEVAQ